MLTVKDVAKDLKVSAAIVYGWIASGVLACHRLGAMGRRGCIRIAETDLAEFLAGRKTHKGPKASKHPAQRRKIKLQHLQLPG